MPRGLDTGLHMAVVGGGDCPLPTVLLLKSMDEQLTKKQAIEFLGLEVGVFKNYFESADEFPALPRAGRGRFMFNKHVLAEWKKNHDSRVITLDREDYALCLDFALAHHYRGYVASDFGTGRQREFGQKITNWVKGQLGEIAVQKFFRDFGKEIKLDFDIRDAFVAQDIIGVKEGENFREPQIGVGIKSSKPKAAYLILVGNEIRIPERKSDVYIFCRPDIPDDHLLRVVKPEFLELVKDKPHFGSYEHLVPDFSNISCEIAGWCNSDELEEVTSIPGQAFENGPRFVKKSGQLRRNRGEWETLIARL